MTRRSERILDVVFERERAPRSRLGLLGLAVGLGVHAALLAAAWSGGPSLEGWAAELSVRVHAELSRTEIVELPEPAAPTTAAPPPSPRQVPAFDVAPHGAPHEHRATALHPEAGAPPAEAGRVLAADDGAPADLTGETFVVGEGAAYAGGATSREGTGRSPGSTGSGVASASPSAPAPPKREAPTRDESRPVRAESAWACAWPREAESEAGDTQSATVRITVGADGRLESASIEADPGLGFGRAALECARAMRYAPALDAQGTPTRSTVSVRVRFWR